MISLNKLFKLDESVSKGISFGGKAIGLAGAAAGLSHLGKKLKNAGKSVVKSAMKKREEALEQIDQ